MAKKNLFYIYARLNAITMTITPTPRRSFLKIGALMTASLAAGKLYSQDAEAGIPEIAAEEPYLIGPIKG